MPLLFSSSKSMRSSVLKAIVDRGTWTAFLLSVTVVVLTAQTLQPTVGVPHDWSHHHLLFSAPADNNQAWELERDPRYEHQRVYRKGAVSTVTDVTDMFFTPEQLGAAAGITDATGMPPISLNATLQALKAKKRKVGLWGQSLNSMSASVGAGHFPAKFSFSNNAPSAANCGGGASPDFVVFNTSVAGSASQASIVAYDNLYSGTCSGSVPQTYWAYNTSSTNTIQTSVVLSGDGSQIGFIHTPTGSAAASLVLLKWKLSTTTRAVTGSISGTTFTLTSGGFTSADVGAQISGTGITSGNTIASVQTSSSATLALSNTHASESITIQAGTASTPGTPPTVTNANYRSCTAPCMTTITFNGGTTATDTNSSPFYDYHNDVLYVGDNIGVLHKFTGVFIGTPGESSSGWPVTVSTQALKVLTSPVYDSGNGNLVFVGDSSGFLYSVTTTGGSSQTVVKSPQVASAGGITDSPILDSTTAKVYVFVAKDMNSSPSTGCLSVCNGVFQFPTNFTSSTALTESIMGVGAATVLYAGSFDDTFYSNPGTAGNLYACGTTGAGFPKLMQIPVSSFISGNSTTVLATNITNPLTSGAASCSPVTEISTDSTHDWIFLSVSANGNANGCSGGCIYNYNVHTPPVGPSASPSAGRAVAGGASGIVIDNSGLGGGSQIYFTYLGQATIPIPCPAPSSATSGGCAVQAAQANLQ